METNQQREEEIEIDLKEIFLLLWSKAGMILLVGMLFALIAIAGTKLLITPQYESVTKMYVLAKQSNDTLTNADLQTSTLLTKDYEELIQSRTVTEAVITKLHLKMEHEDLIQKIEVSTAAETRIVKIAVRDADPYMARDIANEIRNTAAEHIQKVMDTEAVNVVDEANIPKEKCSPSTLKNGFLAGFSGCVLMAAIILIGHISNDTIKTAEDVERYLGLSTLGTIPLEAGETKSKKVRKHHRKKKAKRR